MRPGRPFPPATSLPRGAGGPISSRTRGLPPMSAPTRAGLDRTRPSRAISGAAAGRAAARARRAAAPPRRARMAAAAAAAPQQLGAAAVDPAAIDLAHKLADAAARITTRYFRWGPRPSPRGARRMHGAPAAASCAPRAWPLAGAPSPLARRPASPGSRGPACARPALIPLHPPTPRASFDVDIKSDASPVTVADREAEAAMRTLIKATFPQHGVFGEEHGLELGSGEGADWLWVLDPIDGTKSFITGEGGGWVGGWRGIGGEVQGRGRRGGAGAAGDFARGSARGCRRCLRNGHWPAAVGAAKARVLAPQQRGEHTHPPAKAPASCRPPSPQASRCSAPSSRCCTAACRCSASSTSPRSASAGSASRGGGRRSTARQSGRGRAARWGRRTCTRPRPTCSQGPTRWAGGGGGGGFEGGAAAAGGRSPLRSAPLGCGAIRSAAAAP
jgi:hypothetical protein